MPGFYPDGRYDLAGFCVAVVEADELIDGRRIRPGDRVIGLASSGVHSNGYSLVRRVLERMEADACTVYGPEQRPLIQDLLMPTQLYPGVVQSFLKSGLTVNGMAHVTGGGLPENLPRCLPEETRIAIDPESWPRPDLFAWLQEAGDIPERDMWHTFNLGIGYCLVVPADQESAVLDLCREQQQQAWAIGEVHAGAAGDRPAISGLPQ